MSHLYLLAGPNGAGKTSLYEKVIRPSTGLPFVNADEIARALAGGGPVTDDLSLEAAVLAARRREELIAASNSFVAETVFSHPSKVELVRTAVASGHLVHLRVIVVPVELSLARVRARVANGGHDVPETKIIERHQRLWGHVVEAITEAHDTIVYDNSKATESFRTVAKFHGGDLVAVSDNWPIWMPGELTELTTGKSRPT